MILVRFQNHEYGIGTDFNWDINLTLYEHFDLLLTDKSFEMETVDQSKLVPLS